MLNKGDVDFFVDAHDEDEVSRAAEIFDEEVG